MAYILPFFIADRSAAPEHPAHFREILHSFAEGPIHRTPATPPAELTRPRWNSDSRAPEFLHGERLAAPDDTRKPTRYPQTRSSFESRAAWYADRFQWAVIAWSTSFQVHTSALVTNDPDHARRFEQAWRRHPHARTWQSPGPDRQTPMLLGVRQTHIPDRSFRIALISEWEHEGDAVWDACDCDRRTPYLHAAETSLPSSPEPPVDWSRLGFRALEPSRTQHIDGLIERITILQPVSRQALSGFLRGHNQNHDAAADASWTLFHGDPALTARIDRRGWDGSLESIAHLTESFDWVYTRHHGGGSGEQYEVFSARNPLLTSAVTTRIESTKRDGACVSGLL